MSISKSDLPVVPTRRESVDVGLRLASDKLDEVLKGGSIDEKVKPGTDMLTMMHNAMMMGRMENEVLASFDDKPYELFAKQFGIPVEVAEWVVDMHDRMTDLMKGLQKGLVREYQAALRRVNGMEPFSDQVDSFDVDDHVPNAPEGVKSGIQSIANAENGCDCPNCEDRRNGELDELDRESFSMLGFNVDGEMTLENVLRQAKAQYGDADESQNDSDESFEDIVNRMFGDLPTTDFDE